MIANKPRLSDKDVKKYYEDGFFCFNKPVLSYEKYLKLKSHFEGMLSSLNKDMRPESMDRPHIRDAALFEWLFADEILDLVEPILGPDIVLYSSHFICKPAKNGMRVPWHEDSSYWGSRLTPMEVVTVWLAMDDSNEKNGCMRVIPGTHQNGYSNYENVIEVDGPNVFSNEIVDRENFDRLNVPLILKENEASLHDGKIIHGSDANSSQQRRCGFTMRYISAQTKITEDDFELYLARGNSHGKASYLEPGLTYKDHEKYW
ncbi:MAG: phytanoyl-CoA dioxygenase [Planctomycetota bacterium]|nr:MAG: phytanoyl-CoA dioxygenase [Planctomycetota bacterium]